MGVARGQVRLAQVAPEAQIGEPHHHWVPRGFVVLHHVALDVPAAHDNKAGEALHVFANVAALGAWRVDVKDNSCSDPHELAVLAVGFGCDGKAFPLVSHGSCLWNTVAH